MADEGARTKAHTVTEFLEEAREHMRKRHLSLKTERAYLYRMREFDPPTLMRSQGRGSGMFFGSVVERILRPRWGRVLGERLPVPGS